MNTQMNRRLLYLALTILALGPALASAAAFTHVSQITGGLSSPTSLVASQDGLAVLDPFAQQLVSYSAGGVLSRQVSITGQARGLARLQGQNYLFCERSSGQVVKVDLETNIQQVFLEIAGDPVDILISGDNCHVLDAANNRVLVCDQTGVVSAQIPLQLPEDLPGAWLADLAFDAGRNLYYAWDQVNSLALAFNAQGLFQGQFSSYGGQDGAVTRGGEITCDPEGYIYVTDRYQGQVVVFDPAWEFLIAINPQTIGDDPLQMPSGLAVDATGLVFVSCTEGSLVEVFHLDKEAAPLAEPRVTPISPAFGDTISGEDLQLVVGVQAPVAMSQDLTLEFQVYSLPDTAVPVAGITGLTLDQPTVAGDFVVGTVSWMLPGDLTYGQTFGWKCRLVAAGQPGAWSDLREFTKSQLPPAFRLEQNVPNPFNPRTTISFTLKGEGKAVLGIYDIKGQLVWQRSLSEFSAGRHQVNWDGRDMQGMPASSGIYFYRLSEGRNNVARKMVLMR